MITKKTMLRIEAIVDLGDYALKDGDVKEWEESVRSFLKRSAMAVELSVEPITSVACEIQEK